MYIVYWEGGVYFTLKGLRILYSGRVCGYFRVRGVVDIV